MKNLLLFLLLCICVVDNVRAEQAPIRIGATLALTGQGASWGNWATKGIQLAVDEVNSAGGIDGRKLKVIFEDFGEFDLKRAATAAQKFLGIDDVNAILTLWSEDTEVVWPIANSKGVVTLSIAAGAKDLIRGRDRLFRVWPSDEAMIEALVRFAHSKRSTKAAIIYEQSAYHESLGKLAAASWEKVIGNVPKSYSVAGALTDYRSVLTQIKKANVDTIFVQTSYGILGAILKQAKDLGITALRFGTTGADDHNMITASSGAAEGLVFPRYKPATEEFVSKFKARFGENPGVPADAAYDAMKILVQSMKQYGTETSQIVQGLKGIKDFPGATGSITILPSGDRAERGVELVEIKAGKGQPLGST